MLLLGTPLAMICFDKFQSPKDIGRQGPGSHPHKRSFGRRRPQPQPGHNLVWKRKAKPVILGKDEPAPLTIIQNNLLNIQRMDWSSKVEWGLLAFISVFLLKKLINVSWCTRQSVIMAGTINVIVVKRGNSLSKRDGPYSYMQSLPEKWITPWQATGYPVRSQTQQAAGYQTRQLKIILKFARLAADK